MSVSTSVHFDRDALGHVIAERRAALEDRHRPWQPLTLGALLDRAVERYADRPYVVTDEVTLSYAALGEQAAAIARGLVRHGLAVGDRVLLVLPNGPEVVALRFAFARVGVVAVPVNPQLRSEELAEIIRQAEPVGLVTAETYRGLDLHANLDPILPGWRAEAPTDDEPTDAERADAERAEAGVRLVITLSGAVAPGNGIYDVVTLDALRTDPDPVLDAELARRAATFSPYDVTTLFFTSGTTGRPKGVVSTHDMETRSAYGSAYTRGFQDGRRIFFALPLHHVFAYIEGLLASMYVGGAVIIHPVFDPAASLAAIERHQASEALFVPTMSLAVIDAARRNSYDLGSLHSVMSAAQAAPLRLWTELRELLGVTQLVTGYGMTETSAATTFTMPTDPDTFLTETVGRPKPGGAAGDLVEYAVADAETGELLPAGAFGELVARGPIVAGGYFRRPEETASAVLADGWLRSGDLGTIREDGYLVVGGRSKEVYKRGGELVMPAEVEERLTSLPEVAQAHVVGVPDERMGEVGCAWIVPAEGAEPDADALIAYCAEHLARFKVPAYILFTTAAELPLTASGKVQKFLLGARASEQLGLMP